MSIIREGDICPMCMSFENKVTDTRKNGEVIRRRKCKACSFIWKTYEIQEEEYKKLKELLKSESKHE